MYVYMFRFSKYIIFLRYDYFNMIFIRYLYDILYDISNNFTSYDTYALKLEY